MEKPVRIISKEKVRSFNNRVRAGLEHALNFMLSSEKDAKLQLGPFEPFLMPIETYIKAYKKKSILIKIHSGNEFQGELYWFFEINSAVTLAGMLCMLAPNALVQKVNSGVFDKNDEDAFGEVGNQLCGILDRALREITQKNIHLRMDFEKKVYPDEVIKVESFINTEEYVVLLSDLKIPDYGTYKLSLLIGRSMYENLLNVDLELEGIQRKIVVVHSWSKERMEQIRAQLTSRYTKVVLVPEFDEILTMMDVPNTACVAIDFKGLSFPLEHGDSILLKRLVAHRSAASAPIFFSWANPSNEGLIQLVRLGVLGATKGSLLSEFPDWCQHYTQDTTKK